MDYLEQIYKKNDAIVSRRIADEVILVPVKQDIGDLESIYTLNDVAGSIWERVDGKTPVKKIRDAVVGEYDVSSIEAEEDIVSCLRQLESIEAVIEG